MARFPRGWTLNDIPPQRGKVAVVTGANSGIGYYTALALGRAGATVILAVRDHQRGEAAMKSLQLLAPSARFQLHLVDVSSLDSVRLFAASLLEQEITIDLLILNAGIMMLPKPEASVDGFELQMATNHIGHFALTLRLLPALLRNVDDGRRPAPRVVSVSSIVAWIGSFPDEASKIDFRIEAHRTRYQRRVVYGCSKLANLLFVRELGRRYPQLVALAAHPGGSATNLHQHAFQSVFWAMQSAEQGALPTLRAACDTTLRTGDYVGPSMVIFGGPTRSVLPWAARSDKVASALWNATEKAVKLSATPVTKAAHNRINSKL